jgi:hypothetical protein
MFHLFINGPLDMVFNHLHNHFHLEDFMSGFLQLFEVYSYIKQNHIPCSTTCVLVMLCLLEMAKPSSEIHTMKNHIHQNHISLQLKLKKQLIYNYCAIISWGIKTNVQLSS